MIQINYTDDNGDTQVITSNIDSVSVVNAIIGKLKLLSALANANRLVADDMLILGYFVIIERLIEEELETNN